MSEPLFVLLNFLLIISFSQAGEFSLNAVRSNDKSIMWPFASTYTWPSKCLISASSALAEEKTPKSLFELKSGRPSKYRSPATTDVRGPLCAVIVTSNAHDSKEQERAEGLIMRNVSCIDFLIISISSFVNS
jgi:hypothetical protein